jgi:hypothetical protein
MSGDEMFPSAVIEVLIYELLDAHDETARLADGPATEDDWDMHLAYLRDLQRVGREMMAHGDVLAGPSSVVLRLGEAPPAAAPATPPRWSVAVAVAIRSAWTLACRLEWWRPWRPWRAANRY